MTELRRSPLDAEHRELGAKMVPFGGWEMPLSYPAGTVAEHMACRNDAVVFDVSHLGTVRITAADAFDRLQRALTNDLARIAPGKAQYTHLLDDADGSVLDDIIVWWLDADRFDVMPNASNTERVLRAIGGADVTETRAVLAIQGPKARERLAEVAPQAAAVGRFCVTSFVWRASVCVAAGTGYTGEDGVECSVPSERAAQFWQAVANARIAPAGLGARDTLRLEAGLPLHGHELGPGITPLQVGYSWVVGWDKGEFAGRAALESERARRPARRLRGVQVEGRQPPRQGHTVLVDGKPVGEITSGNYSPVLERGIGLAFLPPKVRSGSPVEVDVRGRRVAAEVVKLPFVRRAE